jgi:hypothetical protein
MIVNDENAAEKVLDENGYLIKVIDVVGVKIGDEPGKLTAALDVLDKAGINVEYLYAFVSTKVDEAIVVFKIEDYEAGMKALKDGGATLLSKEDLDEI